MEGPLVSVAAEALKLVLEKLGTVLCDEYKRFKGVRGELKFLTGELTHMHAFLLKMSEQDPDVQDKVWMKEVRELSYDIEDSLDEFMLHVDDKSARSDGFMEKIKNLLEKTKTRHRVAKAIEDVKKQIIVVGERHARYKTGDAFCKVNNATVDRRALAIFEDVSKLVGIDGPKNELIKLLTEDDGRGSLQLHLKVVSIVGFGGVGKTTLANQAYQELKMQFECCASISVSQNPDMMKVLRTIFSELTNQHYADTETGSIEQLIGKIQMFLKDKRYLIVVDGIWKKDTWETISYALFKNINGSRIITTTRICDVAETCSSSNIDHVYKIRPLDPIDSKKLLLRRIFGSEDKCPLHLIQVSNKILKQCDGLPLAIVSLSGVLSNKPQTEDQWDRVQNYIGRAVEKDPHVERMMQILSLSYYDLPSHLKTCLLYLSIFPEDFTVDKKRLVRRWIAEGFIHGEQRYTPYELGERCFNELINRSLIQPWYVNMYGEVMACRVHDTILYFIISKSIEENFVTIHGDGYEQPSTSDKVRRISLVASSGENVSTLRKLNLSHVRSLTMLKYSGLTSLWDFSFLRVVDFEACEQLEGHHLGNIGSLFQLKYLSIRNSGVRNLPEQIGNLLHLETLNLQHTEVRELPESILQLRRLVHLVFDKDVKLPDGIGSLIALQDLESVNVLKQSLEFTKEIGKLKDLRDVSLCLSYDDCMKCATRGSRYKEYMDNILSSLCNLVNLRSLNIDADSRCADDFSVDLGGCARHGLQKFFIREIFISRIPNWMACLVNIQRLTLYVKELEEEDIVVLGSLPVLVFLQLVAHESFPGRKITIAANHGFKCVRRFEFGCAVPVTFEGGAMPKLERLTLLFSAEKTQLQASVGDFPFGIRHLCNLYSVHCFIHHDLVKVKARMGEMVGRLAELTCQVAITALDVIEATSLNMAEGAKCAIRRAVDAHPNSPKLEVGKTEHWSIDNMKLSFLMQRRMHLEINHMRKQVQERIRNCQLKGDGSCRCQGSS